MNRGRRTTPAVVGWLAAIGVLLVALPVIGLAGRAPWSRLGSLLGSDIVMEALRISAIASVAATAISAVVGIPVAWVLARSRFPGRGVLRSLVLLPLVLPPVVTGVALLFALGRRGVIGEPLERATGLVLPFSIWAVILAATLVAMPFLIITVEGALRGLDGRHEDAAATLGAGPWRRMWRVALPMIRPSLVAGLVLTWARALGEFGATVAFAGNLQGETQTLPLAVFVALEQDREAAIAISLVMVAISFIVLLGLRDRWWGRR